jgi:DNA-binding MarR family transcriptional regulator
MVAEGLVRRVEHGTDRRKRLIVLTPKGRRYCQELPGFLDGVDAQLLTGVTKAEYREFSRILDRIVTNAEKAGSAAIVEDVPVRVVRRKSAANRQKVV